MVFKWLSFHDVAPVTSGVADGQEDQLVVSLGGLVGKKIVKLIPNCKKNLLVTNIHFKTWKLIRQGKTEEKTKSLIIEKTRSVLISNVSSKLFLLWGSKLLRIHLILIILQTTQKKNNLWNKFNFKTCEIKTTVSQKYFQKKNWWRLRSH